MDTDISNKKTLSSPSHEPKAYDIPTFCRLFSVGRTLTYSEIKSGRLKIAKVGRRTVIPAISADEWLKQKMIMGG